MSKKVIAIINGPNLNLVGKREPDIYGSESFDTYIPLLQAKYDDLEIHYHQSNHEGTLIDLIQQYGFGNTNGIILNAGGFTHTSIAIRDAISAIPCIVIEVHLTDINSREEFRKTNYIKDVCKKSIIGKGLEGYEEAVEEIKKAD